MSIDLTQNSITRADRLSTDDERPLSLNGETTAASFGADFQAAHLLSFPKPQEASPPGDPQEDPESANAVEDPIAMIEHVIWLGGTLPIPIELRLEDKSAGHPDKTTTPVDANSTLMLRSELNHLFKTDLASSGITNSELSVEPNSVMIEAVTSDTDPVDPGHSLASGAKSPESYLPFSLMNGGSSADLSREHMNLLIGDQTPVQPNVDVELHSFDRPASDPDINSLVDRPPDVVASHVPNDVHDQVTHASFQPLHNHGSTTLDQRLELSEVVRQVQTMVTEHETRTTIQLNPTDLGRLTLELIDAPDGLKAHLSAEDPTVLRFLERNVQLLESEFRVQGAGHLTFSVGADVSGGLGRGDPKRSDAESRFRTSIEENSRQHTKLRSRRELDMNA